MKHAAISARSAFIVSSGNLLALCFTQSFTKIGSFDSCIILKNGIMNSSVIPAAIMFPSWVEFTASTITGARYIVPSRYIMNRTAEPARVLTATIFMYWFQSGSMAFLF